MRIEDERAGSRRLPSGWRRDALHDCRQHLIGTQTGLGRGIDHLLPREAEIFQLGRYHIGLRAGEIDLIDHGNYGEVVVESLVEISQRLRLDAL